jgi:hypothetical protein
MKTSLVFIRITTSARTPYARVADMRALLINGERQSPGLEEKAEIQNGRASFVSHCVAYPRKMSGVLFFG